MKKGSNVLSAEPQAKMYLHKSSGKILTNNYLHSEILGMFPQEVDNYSGNAFAITTLTHSIQQCCQLPSNSRNLVMVTV